MKTSLRIVLLCGFILLGQSSVVQADCSMEQAHAKMRALQQIFTENSSVGGEEGRKYSFMARDTSMVGHLLASKKYGEACAQYDQIAKQYGVDLAGNQKKLAPVTDPKARAAGKCDSLAANLRVNGVYTKFSKKRKTEGASDNEIALEAGSLMSKLAPAFPLVQTDPNGACQIAAQVEKEYGLN